MLTERFRLCSDGNLGGGGGELWKYSSLRLNFEELWSKTIAPIWMSTVSIMYIPPSDVIIEKSDISLIKMSISFFTCRGYEVRVHDRGCSNLDKHDPIERICFYRRCRDSWYRRTNVWTPDVWRRNRPKTIRKGPKAPKGATRNKLTGRPAMNFFYKRPFFFFIVIWFSFFCSAKKAKMREKLYVKIKLGLWFIL